MGEVSLEKAKFHLETAQYFLERLDGVDDLAINMVGFHLAQAVEVFTRHFLEMDSGKVPTLSDIGLLLELLEDGTALVIPEELDMLAGALTMWGERTKYEKDTPAAREFVLAALAATEELFSRNGIPGRKIS